MNLRSVRPLLWTDNLEESIRFYTSVLGFEVTARNDDWGWANLAKDQVELMLSKPNANSNFEKSIFTGSFYFNTEDVNKLWEEIKNKARICYDIETFEWQMREFAIYDNNGYILQFGQDVNEIPGER